MTHLQPATPVWIAELLSHGFGTVVTWFPIWLLVIGVPN